MKGNKNAWQKPGIAIRFYELTSTTAATAAFATATV
jgi:hypothetical protein